MGNILIRDRGMRTCPRRSGDDQKNFGCFAERVSGEMGLAEEIGHMNRRAEGGAT